VSFKAQDIKSIEINNHQLLTVIPNADALEIRAAADKRENFIVDIYVAISTYCCCVSKVKKKSRKDGFL